MLGLTQHLPGQCIQKLSFLEQIMGNSLIELSLILILNLKSLVNTGPGREHNHEHKLFRRREYNQIHLTSAHGKKRKKCTISKTEMWLKE